jgi:hypothetical protein
MSKRLLDIGHKLLCFNNPDDFALPFGPQVKFAPGKMYEILKIVKMNSLNDEYKIYHFSERLEQKRVHRDFYYVLKDEEDKTFFLRSTFLEPKENDYTSNIIRNCFKLSENYKFLLLETV